MIKEFQTLLAFIAILSISNAMSISYGFSGINSEEFDSIFHKFPLPSLAKVLQNMEDHTELILRPFNFGATQSYTDHTGLGKNTNVKGKSCYLDDATLNGKITYIQNNAYTGRTQKEDKITYIGKYLARDRLALEALTSAASSHCSDWQTKSIDEIKQDIIDELASTKSDDPDFKYAADYIKARFIFKVDIQGTHYLTTQFVTISKVQSNTQLPVTTQKCEHGHCHYQVGTETTNVIDVLAYQALNFDTCEFKAFELVADMDIMTIHFPHEDSGTDIDLKQYFNDATGQNCVNSFKLAFGISPQISMIYDYIHKLMEATAEWGLIRHSIEALNFCFVQPYESGDKYYIKLTRDILGNGQITMIKQATESRIIPDTVRQWVMQGKCTPLNPSWVFLNDKQPKALMWTGEERESILNSPQFLNNNCPTYDVIRMIQNDGAQIPIASLREGGNNLRVQHKKSIHKMAGRW